MSPALLVLVSAALISAAPSAPPAEVPVFYNLYISAPSDVPWVSALVQEQLQLLRPENKVYVHSIGERHVPANTTLLEHHAVGDESVTLRSLWEHCASHPDGSVVYLHSKGSFHPTAANILYRSFITRGALSAECAHMPDTCNVCASRMSPLPHPHMPGNMFRARCSYIAKLPDPSTFAGAMKEALAGQWVEVYEKEPSCRGLGRMALEHWVLSHPDAAPCDLYQDLGSGGRTFLFGYNDLPPLGDFSKVLAPAPRFPLQAYHFDSPCPWSGQHLGARLAEYRSLYGLMPGPSWWGWYTYGTPTAYGWNTYEREPGTNYALYALALATTVLSVLTCVLTRAYAAKRNEVRQWRQMATLEQWAATSLVRLRSRRLLTSCDSQA